MATKKTTKKTTKHAGGRPSKYRDEFCQQIIDYFRDAPLLDEVEIPHYKDGEVTWTDTKRFPAIFPTLVQFAKSIGVSYPTVYDWQDEKSDRYRPEFSTAYARAKMMQKNFLIQAGLSGVYNAQFTVFVAKNVTDMRDKQDIAIDGPIRFVVERGQKDYKTPID